MSLFMRGFIPPKVFLGYSFSKSSDLHQSFSLLLLPWMNSFTSESKGFGKFPNGRNIGSGTITHYPHGAEHASYQGTFTTAEEGEQFIRFAHEEGKVIEGGKVKGIVILSGFTNSQKLSWMNSLVMAGESEFDPATQQ
jgi:hypothetical protein